MCESSASVSLVIPSGGVGSRFKDREKEHSIKKHFYKINNTPIIIETIRKMIDSYDFDEIIVGIDTDDIDYFKSLEREFFGVERITFVPKGSERWETVLNCLKACSSEYVCIHDSVRPFVTPEVVAKTIKTALTSELKAAVSGYYSVDNVYINKAYINKKQDNTGDSIKLVDRDSIFLVQTPQVFEKNLLLTAFEYVLEKGLTKEIKDEGGVLLLFNKSVELVESSRENIKITYKEDIDFINGSLMNQFKGIIK